MVMVWLQHKNTASKITVGKCTEESPGETKRSFLLSPSQGNLLGLILQQQLADERVQSIAKEVTQPWQSLFLSGVSCIAGQLSEEL